MHRLRPLASFVLFALIPLLLLLAACRSDPAHSGTTIDMAADPRFVERPYSGALYVPTTYSASSPAPLVVMLHGYGFPGEAQEIFFNWTPIAEAHGFLYVYPTGTIEPAGNMKPFWNATDACCNYYGSTVDDSGYLAAMIDDIAKHYAVDPKRIFVTGHSNGGFMAHRMACDSADRIAGIASLAGATWADDWHCVPAKPVGVLQIHGTLDAVVLYGGGKFVTGGASYPSARTTTSTWAKLNGCGALDDTSERLDLEALIPFSETKVARATGCSSNGAAELWSIQAAGHVPIFNDTFKDKLFEFYDAHAKP